MKHFIRVLPTLRVLFFIGLVITTFFIAHALKSAHHLVLSEILVAIAALALLIWAWPIMKSIHGGED